MHPRLLHALEMPHVQGEAQRNSLVKHVSLYLTVHFLAHGTLFFGLPISV